MSISSISSISSNLTTYYQSTLTTNNTSATTNTSSTEPTSVTSTNTQTTSVTTTNTFTTPTKWGFNVDRDGYFGVDFNKAAGLPENMKINQKMMDMASDYSQARGDNMGPLTIISKVWNLYKTVAGNTFDPDGDGYMDEKEVDKMPYSYVTKGTMLDGLVSIQMTEEQSNRNQSDSSIINTASGGSLEVGIFGFGGVMDSVDKGTSTPFKTKKDYIEYVNGTKTETSGDNDKISTGELFSEFFYGRATFETVELKTMPNIIDSIKNYNKFLESGESIKDWMSKNMSQDRIDYLVKGIGTIDGKFDQSLVDTFFTELDKSIEKQRVQYKSNQYASLGSTTAKSTYNSPLSQPSKAYQGSTGSNVKLPSGSLISASA